ncbi:MAG: prolipoprotein diacylglyceryl transferase [candidate division KSB1 bacterium]|nr:prolipoprotein diacylglyceryl transferase [candidate division KSB1 bacterium]MDZ7336357.1 prolipoprotein diacylglyceryl transferase [candidate division KSB1 bacterium]MDZ7356663.1 prolipoprotein diacylglyceryl transferase [candidate division KSB1 bacterium]MDZ7398540.1 prolipoprotein diacylglyceryl transferase [candidate division KSB1 bacterium]
MYPVLFRFGAFELRSYGLALALSVALGIWISLKRAPRYGVKKETILDLAVIIMLAAIIGSRFWYVIYHIDEFRGHWFDTINPFQGGTIGIAGLSMVGGVVLAILSALVYAMVKKLDFLKLGDTIAPVFLLGEGIVRAGGCFLNGCCFGRPTDSPLGIVFPPEGVAGSLFPHTHLWPAQLFASALGFIGFALALWLDRKSKFKGFTFWLVFGYYAIDRFIVDQFRYYESPQVLATLGPITFNANHLLLAGLFIFSVFFFIRGWRQQQRSERK